MARGKDFCWIWETQIQVFVRKAEAGGEFHPIYLKPNFQGTLQWTSLLPSRKLLTILFDRFRSPWECYPIANNLNKLFVFFFFKKLHFSRWKWVSMHTGTNEMNKEDLFYISQFGWTGVGVGQNQLAGIRQL